jgi:glucokinase
MANVSEQGLFPVLIGDIGGTNARFALVPDREARLREFRSVATADFTTIEDAIASVLAGSGQKPRAAIIDVAGPITGNAVHLTNADWLIKPHEVMERLKIENVILLNDFEALALALTALKAEDLASIGGGAATSGAKVVLGPGTGLGVGALIEAAGLWIPVPGEGGHVTLGPAEPDEFSIWANIEPEMGRISAETILCGRGLVNLYRAVALTDGRDPLLTTPADITKVALDRSDPIAVKTVSLWTRLLGRVAGDMALVFMARGGAYVAGGIPPRILPFIREGDFRRAFEEKAPHQAVMAAIPSYVVVGENPALHGLAAFARTPERFGVNLAGRRWSK